MQNVDRIQLGERQIILVGTAHVSQSSVELARQVIETEKPDSVAIELCDSRYKAMSDPHRWRNMDIVSIIRKGQATLLLAQIILTSFQKRIGKDLDIKPGAEMMQAVESCKSVNAQLILADRDVKITLKRTWNKLGFWSMSKLLGSLLMGITAKESFKAEEIEKLKSSDALEAMMQEFADALPDVKTTLIDERDRYLTAKIQAAPGQKVVAVLGAGHIPGVKRYLGQEIDLTPLETIPPPKLSSRIIAWSIPILTIAIMAYACFDSGPQTSIAMAKAWFWVHVVFTAIATSLALAHPFSIIVAAIVAPFTALNPMVAAGWFAGLVEAFIRRPTVADLETLGDDAVTLRGFWKNRVTRILLVVAFANIGSSLGTLLGVPWVAAIL